jgi:hypothetical protein
MYPDLKSSFYRYIDKTGRFSTENPPINRKNYDNEPEKGIIRKFCQAEADWIKLEKNDFSGITSDKMT